MCYHSRMNAKRITTSKIFLGANLKPHCHFHEQIVIKHIPGRWIIWETPTFDLLLQISETLLSPLENQSITETLPRSSVRHLPLYKWHRNSPIVIIVIRNTASNASFLE